VSIGTLMAFVIVSVGIIFMRYQNPNMPRAFKTPWVPVVPALSAIVSFALMASLGWHTWRRLIIWMVIGVLLYFLYGYRNSKAQRELYGKDKVMAD